MNIDTLDRLLLDRALGALDAESAELLDAYLAAAPSAADRAARYDAAAQRVRAALLEPATAERVPPFPHDLLARKVRTLRLVRVSGRAVAAAAVLMLGVWIGSLRPAPQANSANPPPPRPIAVAADSAPRSPHASSALLQSVLARAAEKPVAGPLVWTSVAQLPTWSRMP